MTDNPKVLQGIEDSSQEYVYSIIIADELREITCPFCEEVRHVEPDAEYIYTCGCDNRVKVPELNLFP